MYRLIKDPTRSEKNAERKSEVVVMIDANENAENIIASKAKKKQPMPDVVPMTSRLRRISCSGLNSPLKLLR